jgi:amidase
MTTSDLSIAELQRLMSAADLTALDLTRACLERIRSLDRTGPSLYAVIETNPEAEEIARTLDAERRAGRLRGPLHGVPILLKDNIATADLMSTTAGSLALVGARPREDATVARRLRDAGAILLGKANMSEWANFRSNPSSSGWSARGGQARNPYVLDRTPCGSSSGSATAVAAGYVPASLGTETSGSILCPAAVNAVVGIKPTVGLTSRAGVVPVAHSQDTVGPFGRSVADAAAVLSAIMGPDPRDAATARGPRGIDYSSHLVSDGLRGVRLGVLRGQWCGYSTKADTVIERAIAVLADLGAAIVDPAIVPSADELRESHCMMEVLCYEFKADLNAYLRQLDGDAAVRSLDDVIRFNREHRDEELIYFGQELFEQSNQKPDLTDPPYREALDQCRRLSREQGIDAAMMEHQLDALVALTGGPAWPIDLVNGDSYGGGCAGLPAMAGYPAISLPVGYVQHLPIGLTMMGRAWSEPVLLRLAFALEQALAVWHPPEFLRTIAATE